MQPGVWCPVDWLKLAAVRYNDNVKEQTTHGRYSEPHRPVYGILAFWMYHRCESPDHLLASSKQGCIKLSLPGCRRPEVSKPPAVINTIQRRPSNR